MENFLRKLFCEHFDRFYRTYFERKWRVERGYSLLHSRLIVSHLYEWWDECHISRISLCYICGFFREVDRPLQVDDDFLCCFLSDSWNRWEESIIFELYRLEEVFSSESEEIQGCFSTDTIDLHKLTKEIFLIAIDKSKERLSCIIDIVMEPYLWFFSYANIRKKKWRYEYL